jgi:hypothetical protein
MVIPPTLPLMKIENDSAKSYGVLTELDLFVNVRCEYCSHD